MLKQQHGQITSKACTATFSSITQLESSSKFKLENLSTTFAGEFQADSG